MSDVADRAEWRIAKDIQTALQHARKVEILNSDGHCCFCDEPVSYPALFCDVECRDDYDRKQSTLRRTGRIF
ncbi:DUF2116 family Zn-ribbon domain-containing protein [Collimonas fungivorans]|uniref:DUF2116 family Zn-ribbon domain-containing protein n=1 Tax=Collimonas fungivorans TaxID=158899 RepID=UPI0005A1539D|nr:DUF2116 family Zn-ribbon domain-containing protein [Collimonas fungivorans]